MSRTLFVGDVHSCADELQRLLSAAAADRIILLGDVFNKGPEPERTWELVRDCGAESVLGNHDLVVIERAAQGELLAPEEAVAWLKTLPVMIHGPGWTAVHGGVDPVLGARGTTQAQAVSLRRTPPGDPNAAFWWQQYTGTDLVIYGHDAVRGLQDHRPQTLGLDTGCVYGQRLTGYLLQTDELISVEAARMYRPV